MAAKKLKVLKISKKKWCRGDKNRGSNKQSLLQTDIGSMCCLGFLGKKIGARLTRLDDDMYCGFPSFTQDKQWPKEILDNENHIAVINDGEPRCSDADRVRKLRPFFRRVGYRIQLVP